MIAAERRFTSAFDTAACGLVVCDPDGTIQSANARLGHWLNASASELTGTPFTRILAPASALMYEMQLRPRLALGRRVDGAFLTLLYRNGQAVPTVINAAQHDDGVLDVALVCVREREAYEETLRRAHAEAESARAALADTARSLRESESLVRAQFAALPFPTFVWRVGPDGEFRLDRWNESGARLAGLAAVPAQLAARTAFADSPAALDAMRAALTEHRTVELELNAVPRALGDAKILLLTVGPLAPDRVVMHARDITAQREAESRQQHGLKMQALGQMVAGAAHEFNNLLAVIQGNLEFVRHDLSATLPSHSGMLTDLDAVQDATLRAVSLVRQMLVFSGRAREKETSAAAHVVVQATERMLRPMLGSTITLEIKLGATHDMVRGDGDQLAQILTNLVINARDAVQEAGRDGRVFISTSNVDLEHPLDEAPAGEYLRLSVGDNGVGMPPEVRARAFEPFFTTKEVGRGTGLGLAMIYGAVRDLGGHVEIESEPGSGTTITLLLPRADN